MGATGVDTVGEGAQLGGSGKIGGRVSEGSSELLSADDWGFDLERTPEERLSEFTVAIVDRLANL